MAVFERVHREEGSGLPAAGPAPTRRDASQLLTLQRLAGNAAVSALVAQRQDEVVPNQTGGGGGGGGGGNVNVSAIRFRKSAFIDVSSTNGTITDATAQIG